jgi:aspartate carbamoyltransferase catalytic subunit
MIFDGGIGTSLEKGETVEDSILNIAAMLPKILVIRCGDAVDLPGISKQLKAPIVNAGWGRLGHPTQALLDVFTMQEHFQNLQGLKLLIIGDIIHSRVAASHFELAQKLNIQLGLCGPNELLPADSTAQRFEQLEPALQWADVVMSLRVQFERHQGSADLNKQSYRENYGLNSNNLKFISKNSLIMHPGPINHGVEMESEIIADSRSRIYEQVTNGVYIREAILRSLIGDNL